MEDKINRKEDVYNNALLVGNAFYNASYFGSTRFFYENKIFRESQNLTENFILITKNNKIINQLFFP